MVSINKNKSTIDFTSNNAGIFLWLNKTNFILFVGSV